MKKLRLPLVAIMLLVSVMLLSSCSALDGVFLLGEDIFDSVIGAIDKSPLGAIYDALNIEGLLTGENGGNFENPDEEPEETVKVESIALDTTGVKTVFKYGEEFSAEGIKIVATFTDGTTKELSLSEVSIKTPDTSTAGVRVVSISYGGKSARYEITVNPRVYPAVSDTSLLDILAKNESTPYRVEAEDIDLTTTDALGKITDAAEGVITSEGKYLAGLGAKYNYFGFSFTANQAYENVTVVIRVANSGASDLLAEQVKTYLNFRMDDNGVISGELPLEGYIIEADGQWVDIIIRNVALLEGVNTISFDVQGKDAFDIDYVDLYVGSRYINSVVEIAGTDRVIKDIETLDTEKAFTRSDVAEAHGLKDGQLFVEPVKKEWPSCTTSGGTSVGAIGKGSLISTTIRLSEDATVRIWFKASKTTPNNAIYFVDDHWSFYIDGVKLQFVDYIDIHGGDKSQEMYWEWKLTNLGEINLSAGDHTFVIEVVGTDCNVDTVEFEILSFGSYDEIGKGLDEQKHVCADVCEICGKCTTNCTEDACADKCDGCRPEIDATISDGRVVIEAENLPIDKLVPESGSVKIESFTGGMGVGGIKSGYQTFTILPDKDMTVNFIVNFAKRAGGSILTYIPSVAVNGKNITLNNSTVPAGTADNPYWNLSEIILATIELKANVKYEFKVSLTSGNIDKYIFDVVEGGGQQIPEDKFDLTLATDGVTKYELENIDCSQCDINTRSDFVPSVGEGNCGKGSGRIYGYDNGSVFRVYVKVTEACTVKIGIAGFADASRANGNEKLSTYTWKLGDQIITPDADAAINTNGQVGEAVVGTVEITEAGVYVFEFTFGIYTDLDYLSFEIVK